MDKKTLLAVVVAVVVITVGFMIQGKLAGKREPAQTAQQKEQPAQTTAAEEKQNQEQQQTSAEQLSKRESAVKPAAEEETLTTNEIDAETDLYKIIFSAAGGSIQSLELKKHQEKDGSPVDMVYRGDSDQNMFDIRFGGPDVKPVTALFSYRKIGKDTFEFSRDFRAPAKNGSGEGELFTLKKRYIFKPDEYMFELQITIENSKNDYPNLDFNGTAYTLSVGPQIGPKFVKLDGRRAFRKYSYYADGKKKTVRLSRENVGYVDERALWAGIVGKYFSVIAVPNASDYKIAFYQLPIPGVPVGSEMYLSRPVIKSSKNTDSFKIYAGPNIPKDMARYNLADKNSFGVSGYNLETAVDRSKILGWLQSILKWLLMLFYRMIPNYGVAIILLTIFIKLIMFPITKKSYDSTSKMQALNPKIQELREKYKDNPQKMNQEMNALYKKEGVSPLGGCLPLLLQMPFFIALYGLLNTHFALRGAVFIPGWISDLSSPESIFNFAPTRLPVIGSDIRLLPIIFVATQLLSSKLMQTPSTSSSQGNMKLMTYAMPIVFFFILYDAPSGLLVYWIMTNVFTVAQQWVVNRVRKKKEEAET